METEKQKMPLCKHDKHIKKIEFQDFIIMNLKQLYNENKRNTKTKIYKFYFDLCK